MKKGSVICFLIVLMSSFVFADNSIVSVSDNSINISAQEYANCHGAICDYTFVLSNLGASNKKVNISNIFYNSKVIPLKLERYELIEEDVQVNTPYICKQTFDPVNGTTVDVYCDNITTQTVSSYGYSEIPSNKYDGLKTETSQWIMLHKDENIFKATVFLPLGQESKFDIITDNDDGTQTTLDPWANTNEYYINLTPYPQACSDDRSDYIFYEDFESGINLNNWTNPGAASITTSAVHSGSKALNCSYDTTYFCMNTTAAIFGPNMTIQYFVAAQSSADVQNLYLLIFGKKYSVNMWKDEASSSLQNFNYNDGSWKTFGIGRSKGLNYWDRITTNAFTSTTYYLNITNSTNSTIAQNYTATSGNAVTFPAILTMGGTGLPNTYILYDDIKVWNRSIYGDTCPSPVVHTFNNIYDNLTILNQTITGVLIEYDSSIINQINDTALGNNLVSGQCYALIPGQTALNWSISANINYSVDMSRVVNYTFSECGFVNESRAMEAILDGLSESEIADAYTDYDNKAVYIRLANSSQYYGTFDKFIVFGNKRWAFNYEQNATTFNAMFNITPVFYVWQNYNMTYYQIRDSVKTLVDSTN